jgi:hypothetical protein
MHFSYGTRAPERNFIMTPTTIPAEQLVIITPRIEIWSGSVKLVRDTDLHQVNGQLPPKGLVSDGRKQLINTTPLRPLHNVRKQIERSLKAEGFAGLVGTGIAVTAQKAESFLQELPKYEQEFEAAREGLIKHLPQHYTDQENLYPAWQGMLQSARLSGSEVRSRCKFGVAVFRLAPPDPDPQSKATQLYTQMTESALPTLMQDIAVDAEELLQRFKGKSCVKQSQVLPVKRLVRKLKGFAFLDPRVQPVAAGLLSVLDSLPQTGALNAPQTACCVTVLSQLMNPTMIISHGIGVIAHNAMPSSHEAIQNELPIDEEALSVVVPPHTAPAPTRRRGFSVAL